MTSGNGRRRSDEEERARQDLILDHTFKHHMTTPEAVKAALFPELSVNGAWRKLERLTANGELVSYELAPGERGGKRRYWMVSKARALNRYGEKRGGESARAKPARELLRHSRVLLSW